MRTTALIASVALIPAMLVACGDGGNGKGGDDSTGSAGDGDGDGDGSAACGNGIIEGTEECDDGPQNDDTGAIMMVAADFTGDTVVDVVASLSASNEIQLFTGGGNGAFAAGTKLAAGAQPDSIVLDDFTGDGELDIVVSNNNSGTVSRYTGDGMGGFSAQVPYPVGDFLINIAVGDVNADGSPDIIGGRLGGISKAGISLLVNDGMGAFAAPMDILLPDGPIIAAFGDVTGDGAPDIVTANSSTVGISVLPGNP